jgi:hypothetical protein
MTGAALEWSFNPWRDRPGRAWGGLAALLGCCALVVAMGMPAGVAIGLSIALGASFGPAFLPARFRVDDQGITSGRGPFSVRRPWSAVHRALRSREGILLSPFGRRHWLDAYRAWFLPLPPAEAERLRGALDDVLGRHGL